MEIDRSVKHDLLAPLCNIRAFNEELKHVAKVLESFADSKSEENSEDISETCKQLANDDILMCTAAISRASDTLEERITELLKSNTDTD